MTGKTTVFSSTIGDVTLPLDEQGNMAGPITIAGNLSAGNISGTTSGNLAATGGTIDGVTIGATTAAPATVSALHLDTGNKTVTLAGNLTGTLNKMAGVLTTGNLSTAAGAGVSIVLTNSDVAATDQAFASVANGSSTTGTPAITTVQPGAGNLTIGVQNIHATAAFNGSLAVSYAILKN